MLTKTNLLHEAWDGWEDLRVPASVGKVPASNSPDWEAYKTNVGAYAFDKATDQSLYFIVQIPHSWDQVNGRLYPHVHWIPKTSGTAAANLVCWAMDYTWAGIGKDFGSTVTIWGNVPYPNETVVADRHYLTRLRTSAGLEYITKDGAGLSSMLICRIYRDANGTSATDNYDDDAYLLEIDFHYKHDRHGSRQESTK